MRWAELAIVACGCSHAAPAAVPIHNAAASSPALGRLELVFATARHESDGGSHRELVLDVPRQFPSSDVAVLERASGKLHVAHAELVDTVTGEDAYFEYVVRLPDAASEDDNDVVVVSPGRGASALEVALDDARRIDKLENPRLFAALLDVGRYGIDLDGDHRADLGFVSVCVASASDESACETEVTYVVRRDGDAWKLTDFCANDDDTPCVPGNQLRSPDR